jgi:hypothetical protein
LERKAERARAMARRQEGSRNVVRRDVERIK